MMKLGWPAREERCAGWRTHGRGDVMVLEPDTVTGYCIKGRQRIIRSGKQPVSHLVNDDENDIVGRLGRPGCRRMGPRASSRKESKTYKKKNEQTVMELDSANPCAGVRVLPWASCRCTSLCGVCNLRLATGASAWFALKFAFSPNVLSAARPATSRSAFHLVCWPSKS